MEDSKGISSSQGWGFRNAIKRTFFCSPETQGNSAGFLSQLSCLVTGICYSLPPPCHAPLALITPASSQFLLPSRLSKKVSPSQNTLSSTKPTHSVHPLDLNSKVLHCSPYPLSQTLITFWNYIQWGMIISMAEMEEKNDEYLYFSPCQIKIVQSFVAT